MKKITGLFLALIMVFVMAGAGLIITSSPASAHIGDIEAVGKCVDADTATVTYTVGWSNGTATGKLYQRSGLHGHAGNAGNDISGWTFVKNVSGASGHESFTVTHEKSAFTDSNSKNGPWWSSKVVFSDNYGVAADTRVENFDWSKCASNDWTYEVSCTGVSGSRPNTDSVDSNIRIKNLYTDEVKTFNYHGPDNGPSGPFNYTLANYGVPADWTYFEIQWVQVNGTNYHWEGKIVCGQSKPPVCHPVNGNGETGQGWNIISPAQASSHIDESLYPDGHYWKHETNDGRHDIYAVDGGCPPRPEPAKVVPQTPTTKDVCGTTNDRYGIPDGPADVTYSRDDNKGIVAEISGFKVWGTLPAGWVKVNETVARYDFDATKFTNEPCGDKPKDTERTVPRSASNCEIGGVSSWTDTYTTTYAWVNEAWVGTETGPVSSTPTIVPWTPEELEEAGCVKEPTTRTVPHTEQSCELNGINNWTTTYTTTYEFNDETGWEGTEGPGVDSEKVFTPYTTAQQTELCGLIPGNIAAECVSAVPFLAYSVEPGDDIEANVVKITFVNPNGSDYVVSNLPLSGKILWPGASATEPLQWPGYQLVGTEYVSVGNDNFGWSRNDVTVKFEVNPTYTTTVKYPDATSKCANPPTKDQPKVTTGKDVSVKDTTDFECGDSFAIVTSTTTITAWTQTGDQPKVYAEPVIEKTSQKIPHDVVKCDVPPREPPKDNPPPKKDNPLPNTGGPTILLGILAALLLAGGTVLFTVARRKK